MARSIQEMLKDYKSFLKDDNLFYGALIVIISIASFGLGRLSVEPILPQTSQNASIVLSQTEAQTKTATSSFGAAASQAPTSAGETASTYVASKKGTKYHLPWCAGASQIKEENKIYFATKAEAEKAGYQPASNCKGL